MPYQVKLHAAPVIETWDQVELTNSGALHCYNLRTDPSRNAGAPAAVDQYWYNQSLWSYVHKTDQEDD